MLHLLRRHPLPVRAFFRHCLVLTYAFPERVLAPLLAPGLTLDTYHGLGFLAIAMVQTEGLRPVGVPAALGQDFFLTGYRIFSRFRTAAGQSLRGLRILRSDTDRELMVLAGNALTHYHYVKCGAQVHEENGRLEVGIALPESPGRAEIRGAASLHVRLRKGNALDRAHPGRAEAVEPGAGRRRGARVHFPCAPALRPRAARARQRAQ